MWLTTLASLATPQLKNAQLAFDRDTERKQAERRLRRRERSDRCSRIAFRPLFAFGDSRLRSKYLREERRGEVAFGGVGENRHDGLARTETLGELQRREDVRAGRDARHQPLLARKAP